MIACYHGLIGSSRNWLPLSELLPQGDTLHSDDIDYISNSMEDIISQEQQRIAQVLAENRIALGNSLGCLVALGVGENVSRIILTAPPYMKSGFIPRSRQGVENYIKGLYCERPLSEEEGQELEAVGKRVSGIISDRKNIPKLRRLAGSVKAFNYWEMVKQHQHKVHVVLGEEDHLSPKDEMLEYLSEHVPEAKVDVIAGCGHAVPLEKPAALAEIVEQYK